MRDSTFTVLARGLQLADDMLEWGLKKLFRSPLALLAIAGVIAFGWTSREVPAPSASGEPSTEANLVARPWVDRLPEEPEDKFKLYFFSKERFDRKNKVGVFMSGNFWKREIELFAFRVEGDKIEYFFPYDESKAKSSFVVQNKADRPEFDMTLFVQSDPRNNGAKGVYFSCEEWGEAAGLNPQQTANSTIDRLFPQLVRPQQ